MDVTDCTQLAARHGFSEYAHLLLNVTNGTLTRLSPCRQEVCTALWGAENSDISGIGMIIGYILDHVLGFALGMSAIAGNESNHPSLMLIVKHGLASFHDCASFFAFSIEIASIVMLIKVDLGISAGGMGNDTIKITHAVAMLVLLPLVYAILNVPTKVSKQQQSVRGRSHSSDSSSKHLTLFVICWALAFYPFYSAMNAAFGPSKISAGKHAVLSIAQFDTIEHMCLDGNSPITTTEANVMISFVILTYIPLSAVLVGIILWSGIQANHDGSGLHRRLERLQEGIPLSVKHVGKIVGLAAIPALAAGHLWTVFRVRQAQKQLATSLHSEDQDNNWTFGQVTAVTLFAPVVFECWNTFVSLRKRAGQVFEKTKTTQDTHTQDSS